VEEGVLHFKLLNWPVAGDSSSKHHADGGRFHNQAESLVVVDPRALSETPEDLAGFVAIKRRIGTKLVREDPLVGDEFGATGPGDKLPGPIAHLSYVLILHSRAPIGVGKRSTYRGWYRGRCGWRHRSSEDHATRKHPEARRGSRDHPVRIHRRSYRYSRRRSSIGWHQSRAHGHSRRRLPRSLGVDDRRGRPLTRWWTIRGCRRYISRAWRSVRQPL
jgi:hypothetical protein